MQNMDETILAEGVLFPCKYQDTQFLSVLELKGDCTITCTRKCALLEFNCTITVLSKEVKMDESTQ